VQDGGIEIREQVALAPFTTFGIGGPARWFAVATSEPEVEAAVLWAQQKGVPLFVLGGGSNLLVKDAGFAGLVLRVEVCGINNCADGVYDVGAGESWDTLVDSTVHARMAGMECLAGIPGNVGGTPVQNVGAYGQEVSETIESVRCFDRHTLAWIDLSKADCRFRYRESLFNTDELGRYIVTRVRFRLRPEGAPQLHYADLQRRFGAPARPTLVEVAAMVRAIRREKGMLLVDGDPDCRSAGSFFKNPIVSAEIFERVASSAGLPAKDVPHWPVGDGRIKLPAAWLLERAGFVKGYGEGPARISTRHTLALTNRGGATCADVEQLQDQIVATVAERFGIVLEREPVLLG
jgi:UDP-N-acetylmuramate dehydrogenase